MAQDTFDRAGAGCHRVIIGPPSEAGALEHLLADTHLGVPDQQVLVIEADPDHAAKLETQLEGIQVIAAALSDSTGQADLVQYNFPGLSSIQTPNETLNEILPGLREVSRKQTALIPVQTLVTSLGKGAAGPLDLYINAAGSEMLILEGIAAANLLPATARLRLRCGAEPMFEGAAGRDAILNWCVKQGFKHVHEETEDADFPELFFEADLVARALEETRQELTKFKRKATSDKAQITKLRNEQKATDVELSDVKATLARKDTDLTARMASLTEAEAQTEKLTQELLAVRGEIEAEQKTTNEIRGMLHKGNGEAVARSKVMEETRIAHEAAQEQAQNDIALLTEQASELKAAQETEQKAVKEIRGMLHKSKGEAEARGKAMVDARIAHEAAQKQTQGDIALLTTQASKLKVAQEAEQKSLRQTRDTLNKRNVAFEAQGEELATAQAELEALAEQLREEVKSRKSAKKSAKKLLGKCEVDLKTRDDAIAAGKVQIEALSARVSELDTAQQGLRQTRDTLNKRNVAFEAQSDKLEAARAEISALERGQKADTAAEQQVAQSKADLAVALRMQMLAQSDLRDLQARFREVEQARKAQQELLQKLTPRLQQAAHQMQHMQLIEAEPEEVAPRLAAPTLETKSPIRPPAGSSTKPVPKRRPRKAKAAKS